MNSIGMNLMKLDLNWIAPRSDFSWELALYEMSEFQLNESDEK